MMADYFDYDLTTDEGRARYLRDIGEKPIEKRMTLEGYLAAQTAVDAPTAVAPNLSAKKAASPKKTNKEDERRPEGWMPLVQHRVIEMKAFGKERPRFSGGKGNKAYMRQEYKNKKAELLHLFGDVLVMPPVHFSIVAVRKFPDRWSKAKKNDMFYKYCQNTPDLDNLAGAVYDALFDDDSRIIMSREVKVWGWEDEIHITITEVDPDFEFEWVQSLNYDRRIEREQLARLWID